MDLPVRTVSVTKKNRKLIVIRINIFTFVNSETNAASVTSSCCLPVMAHKDGWIGITYTKFMKSSPLVKTSFSQYNNLYEETQETAT